MAKESLVFQTTDYIPIHPIQNKDSFNEERISNDETTDYIPIHPIQTKDSFNEEKISNDGYLKPNLFSEDEISSQNSMFQKYLNSILYFYFTNSLFLIQQLIFLR